MTALRPSRICSFATASLLAVCSTQLIYAQATDTTAPATNSASGLNLDNRPIAEVKIVGLKHVPEQLVKNQIRALAGTTYQSQTIEQDIVRINHLGRFAAVRAAVEENTQGELILSYVLEELPLLNNVEIVGSDNISAAELRALILLRPGDPVDPFLIDQAIELIKRAYAEKGFHASDVTYDNDALKEGRLVLTVTEGPKVRIRTITFEGNTTYVDELLEDQIRSEAYMFIFKKGNMDREQLELDAATLRDYYRDRGFLDAQVGRRIDLSPIGGNANVVFLINEGQLYRIGDIKVQFVDGAGVISDHSNAFSKVLTEEQIIQRLSLRPGAPYTTANLDSSEAIIKDLYGKMGYLDTFMQVDKAFGPSSADGTADPVIDLRVTIREGYASTVGRVEVIGNDVTQTHVILRQLDGMTPGRPYDRTQFEQSQTRLANSPLFSEGTITLLGQPGDPVRDAVVEVQEKNTGSVNFGVGVSSDLGVAGNIELTQRNFDYKDLPENWEEMLTGKAFRGAGQTFSISVSPGNEYSNYAISFSEPYLMETDYFFSFSAFTNERRLSDWDEGRTGGRVGFGRRFGRNWSASINSRYELVDITSIEAEAPTEVFALQGDSTITVLGADLTRSTVDSRLAPSRGSKQTISLDRFGMLGGDYDFTKIAASHQQFWTLKEDVLGRKSILSFKSEIGHILESGESPFFENFYAGGHRSFRGFDYRGIGPRGIRNDNGLPSDRSVGGEWQFLARLQYEVPLFEDVVRGVVFTDQGTISDDPGIEEWRVTVGGGFRIKIPFFGQAPFALDFAIPISDEPGDETQFLSFDFSLPLQ